MHNPGRFWRNFDWILAGVVLALIVIGVLVIWSTSFKATALASSSDTIKQIGSAIFGLVVMLIVARTDYRLWGRLAPYFYVATTLLLVAVLFSHSVLGAQRWIPLGPTQLQPSELAKLALIISLARFLSRQYERLNSWRYLGVSLLYLAVPMALVLRQPDLGTALVLGFTWLIMVLVSRISKKQLGVLAAVALATTPFLLGHLKDYQKARLTIFLNPQAVHNHHRFGPNVWQGTGRRLPESAQLFAAARSAHRFHLRGCG
jgi:rod shape determining protein RodA